MLNFMETLYADGEPSAQAGQPSLIETLIPFLFIFIAMYFFMIRPQAKKAKEHADLLGSLKVGDEVVTSGGIIGRIKTVSDDFVSLDIGSSSLKVMKSHVSHLTKSKKAS